MARRIIGETPMPQQAHRPQACLEYLDLMDTKITEKGLVHLKSMPSLRRVLPPASATAETIKALQRQLPECKFW